MRYRIVPKRDFGGRGFYVRGGWVRHGFVVTDGLCNIMPAATWFETIPEAMRALDIWIGCHGDAAQWWKHAYGR